MAGTTTTMMPTMPAGGTGVFMPPSVQASIDLAEAGSVAMSRARTSGGSSSSRDSLDSTCSAASLVDARRSASFSAGQRSRRPSGAGYAAIAASSSLFAPAGLVASPQASPFVAVRQQQQPQQPAPMAYARAQPAALMQPYCDGSLGAAGRLSSPYGMAAAGPSPRWSTTSELECELLAQMQHLPAGGMPGPAASSAAAAVWTSLGSPMGSTAMAHAPSTATAYAGLQGQLFDSASCGAVAPSEATLDLLLAAAAAAAGVGPAPLLHQQQPQQQMMQAQMMLVDAPGTVAAANRARRASHMPERGACWAPVSMPPQQQASWPLATIDVAAAAAADERALAALDGEIAAKLQQLMALRQDAVARKAALLGQGCGFGDGLPVCSSGCIISEASLASVVGASSPSPASAAMVQAVQLQGPPSPTFSALLPGGGNPLQHVMLLGQL